MPRSGFDARTISRNIDELVDAGHTLESAKEVAEAYAQRALEFAGYDEPPLYADTNAPPPVVAPKMPEEQRKAKLAALLAQFLVEVLSKEDAAKKTMPPEVDTEVFHVVGKGSVLIIKGTPSPAELLRREPFINVERGILEKQVLAPLGLTREQVALAWCDPRGEDLLSKFITATNPSAVICMSTDTVLVKDDRSWNLPTMHELARKDGKYTSEMVRKLGSIRKRLDVTSNRMHASFQLVKGAHAVDGRTITTPIHKANADEQIVYGVVLDPYQVDTQDDWCPPAEIEKTAHGFMAQSRMIGLHHTETVSDAVLVESSVEQYPSDSDREKAHNNEPHRVYARKYGKDTVHSGAWIIGVKLSDRLWKKFESGEIDAFSIEGFGKRAAVSMSEMPQVTFVEIGEVGSGKRGRTSQEAH